MPYYHVIPEKPFTKVGPNAYRADYSIVWERPMSFVERASFGRKSPPVVGKQAIETEVFSHDVIVVRSTREAVIACQSHGVHDEQQFRTDTETYPFLQPPIDTNRWTVRLQPRKPVALWRTSFATVDTDRHVIDSEQVRWSPSMDGCGVEFADALEMDTVKRFVGNERTSKVASDGMPNETFLLQ